MSSRFVHSRTTSPPFVRNEMIEAIAKSESKPVRAAWLAQPSFAKDLFRTALSPERGGRAGKGWGEERERERKRESERARERGDGRTDRQTDRQIDRQTEAEAE